MPPIAAVLIGAGLFYCAVPYPESFSASNLLSSSSIIYAIKAALRSSISSLSFEAGFDYDDDEGIGFDGGFELC